MKKALITGITGQDGSYLADLLIEKGYEVHGIIRRSSSFNTSRIEHLYQDPHVNDVKLFLHYGELSDSLNLTRLIDKIAPNEIYNLGAQSHVRVSFDIPENTGDVTGLGAIRLLEALRESKVPARFYQASSSEMYGKVQAIPQTETTPFYPRSPYAVAKLYAYWATVNYRESYGMHASNGILFNHECVTFDTPIIYKKNGFIDIKPIGELVPHREDPKHGKKYQTEMKDLKIWDGTNWTDVTLATATWRNIEESPLIEINSRGGYYKATEDHISFLEGSIEIPTNKIKIGDKLELKSLPKIEKYTTISQEESEFLGMMVADGYTSNGKGTFTKNLDSTRQRAGELWEMLSGGHFKEDNSGKSGYDPTKIVKRINLNGNSAFLKLIESDIYTEGRLKRIPKRILNANREIQTAFLKGYQLCDGLKKGFKSSQEFKSFTTNSQTLAQGLFYILSNFGYRITLHPETRNDITYFHLNINVIGSKKGAHLIKPINEVKSAISNNYEGWVFDLATKSGTFSAGIGLSWIHNSPRRGETFVTKKITKAVARIKCGLQDSLYLGNINAKRDWGYAPEYVEGMWRMLQVETPDDYILATNETHTVKEFLETAFEYVGLDWNEYTRYDERYERPSEVDLLIGDYSKAKNILGWEPKTKFKELVKIMVDADIKDIENKI